MQLTQGQTGHTLLEITAAMVVFSVGILGAWSSVDDASRLSGTGQKVVVDRNRVRNIIAPLSDLISESRAAFIDTSMRYVNRTLSVSFGSDRFELPDARLRHCSSPTCKFHTNARLEVSETAYQCSYQHMSGLGLGSTVRGKTWPESLESCPLDGSPLSTSALMDGFKMFSSRGRDGSFATTAGGEPAWTALVLVFPFQPKVGLPELRRYDMEVSDLLAGAGPSHANWDVFDTDSPSMINLFDFSTDGTSDGVPDGSVPVTFEGCDADEEVFVTGFGQDATPANPEGQPTVIYQKILGDPDSYPYKRVSLSVGLETGLTEFAVEHHVSSGKYWTAERKFTRAPITLIKNVTELAISTNASHPYHSTNNPAGVSEDNIVRLTFAVTTEVTDRGEKSWSHHLDTITFAPRN